MSIFKKIFGSNEREIAKLDPVIEKILNIDVEIEMDKKGKFRVEIMIKTPYDLYRAEETTESIEGSADIALNELKIQIKKDKDRRNTLTRRGGISIKKRITIDKDARY